MTHLKSTRRRGMYKAIVLLSVLILSVAAWRHLSVLLAGVPGGDPTTIIRESARLANDWTTLGSTWDPLLRYAGLAVAISILGPSPGLASGYAVAMLYVAVPASVYGLGRVMAGRLAAALALLFMSLSVAFDIVVYGYKTGAWQYPFVLPFIFAAFAAADISQRSESDKLQWAAGAGACLGLAGLQQFSLTAFAILIIAAAFAIKREFRSLAVTGAVGALFAVGLLLQPGDVIEHVLWYSDRYGQLSWSGVQTTPEEWWQTVGNPRRLLLFSGYPAVLAVWARRGIEKIRPVLVSGVVICGLLWLTRFDSVGYYAESGAMIGVPLLAIAGGEMLAREMAE